MESTGQDPALVMAERILTKSSKMAQLTVAAGRAKNEALAAVYAAETLPDLQRDMPGILKAMDVAEQEALAVS